MDFPTIVYKCPGMHHCSGGTYDYLPVKSEEDLSDALKDGWCKTLPEAMGEKVVSAPKIEKEETATEENEESIGRAELEEMAKGLGIKFDGRTSDAKLADKIDKAMK